MTFTDELFPFRFAFDHNLVVQAAGVSLRKLSGSFQVGVDLRNLIELRNPCVELTYENLRNLRGLGIDVFLQEPQVTMRCQLVEDARQIVAVGTPRFDSHDDFESSCLERSDFAARDISIDLLLAGRPTSCHNQPRALTSLLGSSNETDRRGTFEDALAHALRAAGDLHLRISLDDTIVEARRSHPDFLPQPPDELVGKNVYESCPQFALPLRRAISQLSGEKGFAPFSYEVVHRGKRLCFEARVTAAQTGEVLLLARDVTEQRRLKSDLEHQASHDALTDLPNRKLFQQRAEAAKETHHLFAVLFLDLDGFKLINDRHGHHLGDQVLLHVAATIQQCIRNTDVAARLGGDEFAILLTSITSRESAERIARRLIDELAQPSRIGHRKVATPVSIGIATSRDARDAPTLLQFADIAMYRAKAQPHRGFVSFEPYMYEEVIRRDTICRQLVTASDQGQFINHYQPIVDVQHARIVAMETLARWQHPIRGLLMPEEFITTAEESGAIVRLGEQSLARACQDVRAWHTLQPRLHFNVSMAQLRKTCVTSLLSECLSRHKLGNERVTTEIKEKTLQHDFSVASLEIDKLRDAGFSVCLDEFGAGNSSLGFLERLSIDSVKLAKSFVQQLGQSKQKNQLVKSVVQLAQGFGLDVIAIGVESTLQQDLLLEFGCFLNQGALYSPPIESSAVGNLRATNALSS